jgi:isocitrate dehydrogenase
VSQFKDVKIPNGDLIGYRDGALVIGDHPIIGCLRGDGIGLDITPVMRKVVDARREPSAARDRLVLYAEARGFSTTAASSRRDGRGDPY